MQEATGESPQLLIKDGIATLSLQRPAQLNRLTSTDLLALCAHFKRIESDSSIRVVVLTANTSGQSKPVFCAGYDVASFDGAAHDPRLFEQTVDALASLRPVVIGAVGGSVYGGATDLVLACDLRIGLQHTEFKMPACALGLHYYPSGLRRYVAALGLSGSKQAFLTAKALPIDKLNAWGVFVDVCESSSFQESVDHLANQVSRLAPIALQETKASLNEIGQSSAHDSILREREARSLASRDFAEGREAFRLRRAACFTGQ